MCVDDTRELAERFINPRCDTACNVRRARDGSKMKNYPLGISSMRYARKILHRPTTVARVGDGGDAADAQSFNLTFLRFVSLHINDDAKSFIVAFQLLTVNENFI